MNIKCLSQFFSTIGYPFAITYLILFTTNGNYRIYGAVKFIDFLDRFFAEWAAWSFSHANRAYQKRDPRSRSIALVSLRICSLPVMEIIDRICGIYTISILDIRLLYTPVAFRMPRILRFNVTPSMLDIYHRALARRSYKIKFRYVSLSFPPSLTSGCPEFRTFRQYSNLPRKPATPDATLNVNLVRKLIRSCAAEFVGCTRIWSR